MSLSEFQCRFFADSGYLLLPELFSDQEVAALRDELDRLARIDHPGTVFESSKQRVRALHGCHDRSGLYQRLIAQERLLEPACRLLDDEVYLYQFKINLKSAFEGDVWPWHQDFIFWRKEDGMLEPRVINAALFLDDVTEFNGPLYFIPGSHRGGMINADADSANGDSWKSHVSANLKYSLGGETVGRLVAEHGMVAPKGRAGSVLLFDSNLVHGSVSNITPFSRRIVLITYNAMSNIPNPPERQRPQFLVNRDISPVTAVPESQFLTESVVAV